MTLHEIVVRHTQWINSVGYNNKTPLECLALISSEIGEAANECRGVKPTERLVEELADIILRTCGLAGVLGLNIEAAVETKLQKNQLTGAKPGRLK